MNVSGLVVATDAARTGQVADALRAAGPFTLGEPVGPRLVVALEAADGDAARRWHDWVRAVPGVFKVDVAFVDLGTDGGAADDR